VSSHDLRMEGRAWRVKNSSTQRFRVVQATEA
jgi:hypothetical protein